jgi:predicted anti-sigma-YlaC factor YlaD
MNPVPSTFRTAHVHPPVLVAVAFFLAMVAAGGCSVKRMAVKTMADALSEGTSSYATDDDPQLVKDALPFGLKTLEGLLPTVPRHRGLLRSLASGFTSYSAAFIVPELRGLQDVDLERARAERTRARRMFLRGRDYGLRALEVPYPDLRKQLLEDPKKALARTVKADVPDLYWTAAAWGMAISNGKDQMDLIGDVPIVEALITRAFELDEAWDDGSLHEFLIAFESRGAEMGGSLERARQHFNRAMELARGRKIGPLVSFAENVSVQTQNRKEFDALLDQALAFDTDKYIDTRLANVLAQRKAQQLKAMAGELFLEEKTSWLSEITRAASGALDLFWRSGSVSLWP